MKTTISLLPTILYVLALAAFGLGSAIGGVILLGTASLIQINRIIARS